MKKVVKILVAISAVFGVLIGLSYFIGQLDCVGLDDYDC